jgi:Protein of unknown function (DUF1441)
MAQADLHLDADDMDLIGPATGVFEHPSPRRALADMVRRQRMEQNGEASFDLSDVHGGVTVAWLAQVFRMDPTTVKKRLADCPPLHSRKAGYTYDLKVAAQYLVKPVFNVHEYLKSMKPSELPAQLQASYWDAALKRQKWEENAGQLWRTEAVLGVLAEAFQTIKFTMQLWADNLERVTGLTDEQRDVLVKAVDGLQDELHEALVRNAKENATPALISEIDVVANEGE